MIDTLNIVSMWSVYGIMILAGIVLIVAILKMLKDDR